jgi:plasmid stabilization system protein ParE
MRSSSWRGSERSVKLRIGKRAQRQAERIEEWWIEHRPQAPGLFTGELQSVFEAICERSDAGIGWPTARRPKLRRILMPRSENHVYFQVDDDGETVYVLSIWGGPRGTSPKL